MDNVFQPKVAERTGVLWRKRPGSDHRFICFGPDQDGFEAYIDRDVLEFVLQETHRWMPNETIGLLAGRPCKDITGPYTVICAVEGTEPEEIEATPGHVHMSATSTSHVRHRLETASPGLELVGWYHSHPHSPPVFSTEDKQNQSTLENQHHIGLVVSGVPQEELFRVYRGPRAVVLLQRSELSKQRPWALPASPEPPAEPAGVAIPLRVSVPPHVVGQAEACGLAGVPRWTLLPLLLQAVVVPLALVVLILWRWPLQPDAITMLKHAHAPEVMQCVERENHEP